MVSLTIKNAEYVLSAPSIDHLPFSSTAQIAFIGRSNVGKSSLLNFLMAQRSLARTSRTPGRTRALNLFLATLICKNEQGEKNERLLYFVDLPGIGYAKISHEEKENLSDILSDYLNSPHPIKTIFHLLDCRRQLTEQDIDLSRSLRQHKCHYVAVATKIDELPISKRKPLINQFIKELSLNRDNCIMASSHANIGRDLLLSKIWEHTA